MILLYKYKFGTTLDMANHIWTEYVLVTMKLKLYPSVKSTLLARSYSFLNPIMIKECNEKITLGKFWAYFCEIIPICSDKDPHCLYADYRDRRVERQSHWPEALFRRLAILIH